MKEQSTQFILVVFLGPLGLIYTSVAACLLMLIITPALWFATLLLAAHLDMGPDGLIASIALPWLVNALVGCAGVNDYNRRKEAEEDRQNAKIIELAKQLNAAN